jgi:hypothetical protein
MRCGEAKRLAEFGYTRRRWCYSCARQWAYRAEVKAAELHPPIAALLRRPEPLRICDTDEWYCGCCGYEIEVDGDIEAWCRLCLEHVRPEGMAPPWERTFQAQWNRPCPYSEPAGEAM